MSPLASPIMKVHKLPWRREIPLGLYEWLWQVINGISVLATMGLTGTVVRDLVHYPAARDKILGTAFGLKLAGGCHAVMAS